VITTERLCCKKSDPSSKRGKLFFWSVTSVIASMCNESIGAFSPFVGLWQSITGRTLFGTMEALLRPSETETVKNAWSSKPQGRNQLFISGGGNFHELSSCLFNRGTTFSQTVTDMLFSQTFPKMRTY